ncbi:hypothetical protein GCM10007913_06070 [Devosia yakushimensis]|uniref:DUF1217 domain-containing protein n=1 Tax=Devosia yakushimensis TaxID=470028 RepID=A0ABQ5UAA8_9HYPH|nr:hypothetical protein [Devosia yakushimensis]GLQ08675.1 hypothetical protein GCM10007913_06070 [Devosia yakushimensis]
MVAVNTAYSASTYYSAAASQTGNTATTGNATSTSTTPVETAATSVTLSDAAKAALATKDFATVLTETHAKLKALLKEAGPTNPLEKDKLALDLSSLDARELYAMASNDGFTSDEQKAAGLEMQRRLEAALAGPAAVSKVTGNYHGLYKAAAEYLDSLGPEEKAAPDWVAARAAITEGLKQLQADPKKLPDAGKDDPVAIYLALVNSGETTTPRPITDIATTARKTLDTLYADATAAGKAATFNKNTTVGTYIDMSKFDSRTLSSIVLDTSGQFTTEETRAANMALKAKSGAALLAGFQSAAKSSDPTAFSQNVISIYSSMSAEERLAAGWSEDFYKAALGSYQSTANLLNMFSQATSSNSGTGIMSWFAQ